MKTIYRLRSFGYPMPPPLVLVFNGKLLDHFEDRFGELRAWNGYPFGALPNDRLERVWVELEKKVVTKISRRVVSLASFNRDYSRSFACTGLLIKWPGSGAKRTVVLTSASLVRSRDNEGNIDGNLRIEVFLPPNQRHDGTLELCNLHKNIAIVSFKKGFNAIHPEDIFNEGMRESSSEKVVALGHDTIHGLLMGTIGERSYKDRKLECQELRCSTRKIKKAGIGGPLIDFHGTFVGMNFYDGRDLTPFLPRDKVVDALKGSNNFILPSERFFFSSCCVSYNWVGLTVYELKLKKSWITADLIPLMRRRKTGGQCLNHIGIMVHLMRIWMMSLSLWEGLSNRRCRAINASSYVTF